MPVLPSSLDALLFLFRDRFSAPTFATFRMLVVGFLCRVGEHSVCGMLHSVVSEKSVSPLCSCCASARGETGSMSAHHALRVQATDAMVMYAQLALRAHLLVIGGGVRAGVVGLSGLLDRRLLLAPTGVEVDSCWWLTAHRVQIDVGPSEQDLLFARV